MNWLLVFIPITLALEHFAARDPLVFFSAALAIVPIARLIVRSTEQLATYTGDGCHPWAGGRTGDGYAIQGNILTGPEVVEAMERAWVATDGDHVVIAWPGGSGRYGDESCIDADARLVHEIHHCWVRSKNGGDEPCSFVPTLTVSGALVVARASCEFDAVALENRYRQATGLCERLVYGNFQVPGAARTCRAPETACPAFAACSAR